MQIAGAEDEEDSEKQERNREVHSNQAFGAFWSRVTPPELLYIWLLSFEELRLTMNASLARG